MPRIYLTKKSDGEVILAKGDDDGGIYVTPGPLVAGTALIGKVGIDQSTPNANEVVVKTSALPSGAATEATLAGMSADMSSIDGKLGASTIDEQNVTLTVVDTEYPYTIPANCKSIEFWSRGGFPVRFAFTTGKVATPTGIYCTLKSNCSYSSPPSLNLSSKTVYFASDNAGDVVEVLAWS